MGRVCRSWVDEPNKTFIQLLKKKVGPIRYKNTINIKQRRGNKSKKKEKKRISETNIIEPGNPRKTRVLSNETKNSLGHKKLIPLISVISRVLNRRLIASTKKKEFVESKAWLISIEKLANIRAD